MHAGLLMFIAVYYWFIDLLIITTTEIVSFDIVLSDFCDPNENFGIGILDYSFSESLLVYFSKRWFVYYN